MLLGNIRSMQFAIDHAGSTCPIVLLEWSKRLQAEGLGAHRADVETLAKTLATLAEPTSNKLPPISEDQVMGTARDACPRWLITWSQDLQVHGRSADCQTVARGARTITNIAQEELKQGVIPDKKAAEIMFEYNEAIAKASDAAASYCSSGRETDLDAVSRYQAEALALEKKLDGSI